MPRIDPEVITYKLNISPKFKPVKQRRRKFATEKNRIINEEVKRLEDNGLIREI